VEPQTMLADETYHKKIVALASGMNAFVQLEDWENNFLLFSLLHAFVSSACSSLATKFKKN
jgi:hypothetical protein